MRRTLAFLAAAAFAITSVSVLVDVPGGVSAYTPHDSIRIIGDAGFNETNGVFEGSGTSGDPFVIEGYEIGDSSSSGIKITDSKAYFVIRDVHIYSCNFGVSLINVSHGTVRDSNIENSTVGLMVADCSHIDIIDNVFSNNTFAISIKLSTDVDREDNEYYDNFEDIVEDQLPWQATWVGTVVYLVAFLPLAVIVALLIWVRRGARKKREEEGHDLELVQQESP